MPDDLPETATVAEPEAAPAEADVLPAVQASSPSVLTYAGLLLAGIVLGLFGAVVMASRITVRGVVVPWGVVLSLVTVLALVRGAAWLVGSRRGAALVGLGWVLPTLAFATTNPGGDVLLPDLTRTYVYLVGSAVLVVLVGGAAAAARRGPGGR